MRREPAVPIRAALPIPALLLVAALISPAARADDPIPVLRAWIDAQKSVQSVQMDFRQEKTLKGLQKPITTDGRLYLDRAGLMRWELGSPPRTIAVYKDRVVTVMRPEKREAETRALDGESGQQGDAERAFLESGLPTSVEAMQKFLRPTDVRDEGALKHVRAEIKDSRAAKAVRHLELVIDPARQELHGYDVFFRDGSIIRTRFSRITRNPKLPASLFTPDLSGYKVTPAKP